METKIPSSGTDYALDIDLAYPIDSTRTTFNVTGSNVISHRLHGSNDFRLYTRSFVDRNQTAQTTSCSMVLVRCQISRRKTSNRQVNRRRLKEFEQKMIVRSVPMNRPVDEKTPSYPSSSQRAKDWNKLEAEIKKDEKENKDETGDANSYVFIFRPCSIESMFSR